jgi:hypothetical protein
LPSDLRSGLSPSHRSGGVAPIGVIQWVNFAAAFNLATSWLMRALRNSLPAIVTSFPVACAYYFFAEPIGGPEVLSIVPITSVGRFWPWDPLGIRDLISGPKEIACCLDAGDNVDRRCAYPRLVPRIEIDRFLVYPGVAIVRQNCSSRAQR